MHHRLVQTRKLYGEVFVTVFDDETIVPWKLLSLEDFISYSQQYENSIVPIAVIEDEIFRKCVLDDNLVRNMDQLLAGTVATVVFNIIANSGPGSAEGFTNDLDYARYAIRDPRFASIYDMGEWITIAFPSYRVEDIYKLNYKAFLLLVAQAEKKLIAMNIIQGPFELITKDIKEEKPKKRNIDANDLWAIHNTDPKNPQGSLSSQKIEDVVSPIIANPNKRLKARDLEKERKEAEKGLRGHDLVDSHIIRAQMVSDAQVIYADVLEYLDSQKGK